MKNISIKKWIFVILFFAVLTIPFKMFDNQIAAILYNRGNVFGGFCENIAATLPFIMCSFSCVTLMLCRNTRTTRTKNQLLNVVFGIFAAVFALAAAFYPYRGVSQKNYFVVAAVAVVIFALSLYINFTFFKNTYQKIVMSDVAAVTIISTLIICIICMSTMLLPERMNYAQIQKALSSYFDPNDKTNFSLVAFDFFSAAASAFIVMINSLSEAIPKLKFSGKILFAVTIVWTMVIMVGIVSSGHLFASEAVLSAAVSYTVIFAVSSFVKFREKRI